MGYKQSDFVNRAIARAVTNKDIELITAPTLDTKAAKPKEDEPKENKPKEEENQFKNPYDAFIKTWKQGDPLPLIPPGMTMHFCKFGNPLHTDTNYFDLHDEYKTKKPKVKFKHLDLTLDSKSLGPKLRDEVDTLLSRAMMGRFGLKPWVDDKNKLRCPEGSPAANQFTDQRMSNCFIVSPATAAGSANRMARRAGGAIANASQVGGRTQGGFNAARDMNNLTQQDFIDMGYDAISARMAVGGRITGAMTGSPGTRFDPSRRSGPSEPYLLGKKEKTQRGKRSTMLAMTNHELIRSGAIKLPNGDDIGDITDEANFMRVMTTLFPHVEPNEFKSYFQNAIPANLRWEQKREAKRGIQAFWEAIISEAIANPDHAKWVTQFNVDYNMSSAFEVTLDHFAPALDSSGRTVSNVGRKLVAGRNAAQGGVHMVMKINPAKLFQSSLGFHNGDARSSGIHDSVEGDMHYTATHEFGHLAHFSSAMQALGFDVNTLGRYNTTPTHFAGSATTGGAPAWRPGRENGGWMIDFTNMRNPMNSPSIQLVMDAARNLQTRQYMGGRGNFNSADLQKDLMEFYEAFGEAVTNNITDTAEDLMLMAQFAGGEYAASNPIETRAEYYAARRLYGETNSQARLLTPQRYPFNLKPPRPGGRGPVNQSTRNINYVQDFADAVAAGTPGVSRMARTGIPGTPMTSADVVQRLNNSGFSTFGVHPGNWNLTGAMAMGGDNRRVSLHAQQVQGWVKQNERNARKKNKPVQQWRPLSAARLQSGITGAMSVEKDKPRYPREATYGAFLGEAQRIFGGAKTWEEFKKIYDETEIIFFDYETTGIEEDSDGRTIGKGSPVQIGAVRMKGGKVIDRLNVFMKPDQPLGEWSAKYLKDKDGNTLTDEWLNNQESMLKAHQMLADFAGENAIFGVQYAPFDKDVLDATLEKLGVQWRPGGYLDTKDISEYTLPRWTPENPEGPSKLVKERVLDDGTVIPETRKASNGLADITQYLGVDLGSKHHTADADSEAAGKVMSALIDKAIEKNLPATVLDMKSQKDRVAKAQDDFEKALVDFEQQVLERNSGVTGAMNVSMAPQNFRNIVTESTDKQEKRSEKARNRVEGLEKALDALERTGEWRGGEFGVVVSRGKDNIALDGFDADVTPRNLTKEEVEKEGLSKFKQELEKKIADSKKEAALQEFLARTKKERAEQGILDIEDVPEEEYRRLVEEGRELRERSNNNDIEAFKLDGNQEAVIHVGKAQLDGGVLNPSRTSTAGLGSGSAGDTGALNKVAIRNFNQSFENDAKKLSVYETTMSAINSGQTKFTPRSKEEADAINSLLGISSQYGAKEREELDLSTLPLRDGMAPLIEGGNRRILELRAKQARDSKLSARINESPDFGFLSAYPASRPVTTGGFYGRNAAEDVPEDVAKYYTEAQNTARGASYGAIDIKDNDMWRRWEDNLRGSAYLVIGDSDDTVVSNLGPSDERQLVGVNKPIFGVSSRIESGRQPQDYQYAAQALMARAIKLKKDGIDPSPEKVLSSPLYQSSGSGGITGAMRASIKVASTRKSNRRTSEIKRAINEAGGNFGGDTSVRYIKDLKPGDTMLGATLISETKQARNKERINVLTALKDVVKTDFIPNTGGPQVAAAAPPGAPPPDGPDDGDWKKNIFDVKNALNGLNPDFHKYLNETPIEELKKELEFSILDFHEGLDKQPRTHVPGRFLKDLIENGFKNSHQKNEIAGLDKILAKYEADIGIHPDTPAELRPASGFVLHMDELEREQNDIAKFLKNSGKENAERYFPNLVDFPHSKRTRGNDWNFGNAEIILNPGVADRTAYGNGELFNNHIEPVGMNSSDNEVIARAHIDAAFKTDNRAENIIEHLYNSFKGDHDAYRKEKYATSPGRSWEPREASIAGGFNADDIDEIKIPFDSIPKNFISGHPETPATNAAMGKDSYRKESEEFLNGLKERIISDEVMTKINPSEEEREIIKNILTSSPAEFSIPDNVQKGMNRYGADEFDIKQDIDKYLRLEAAEAMRKAMDERGIKLSITNKFGLNVFDPRAFDKNASKKATAREAMRNKIEKQMEDLIKDMRDAKGRGDKDNIASGITGSMSMFDRRSKKKPDTEAYNPFKNVTEESMDELKRQADEEGIVFERSLTGKMSTARPLDEIVEKGPKTLPYGRDKSGVVKVASTKEHEAKFGRTAAEQTKYFKDKYDLEMEIDDIFGGESDSYKTAHFASLQALDDILSNFDAEDLFGGKAASDMRFRVRRQFTMDEEDGVLGSVDEDPDAGTVTMEIPVERISNMSDEIADVFITDTKLRGQALSALREQIGKKFHGVHDLFLQFENNNKIPRTPENELKIKAKKEEMAKRLAYGVMVHEMGHVLDKLASRKSNDGAGGWGTALEKDFGQLPSVTKYGSTNNAEKFAEAFSAWWLFGQNKDVDIVPQFRGGTSGELYDFEDVEKIRDVASKIVKPIFGRLGSSIKSAKQESVSLEKIPPMVQLYAILSTMKSE